MYVQCAVQVKALEGKQLQCYTNAFVVQSARAITGTTARADARLASIDADLQRLDALVAILEAKARLAHQLTTLPLCVYANRVTVYTDKTVLSLSDIRRFILLPCHILLLASTSTLTEPSFTLIV